MFFIGYATDFNYRADYFFNKKAASNVPIPTAPNVWLTIKQWKQPVMSYFIHRLY